MKEIFIIVLVIIGALIGAGFASGQEIYSFFYCYGLKGILGLILTFVLMTILIYKSLILYGKSKKRSLLKGGPLVPIYRAFKEVPLSLFLYFLNLKSSPKK